MRSTTPRRIKACASVLVARAPLISICAIGARDTEISHAPHRAVMNRIFSAWALDETELAQAGLATRTSSESRPEAGAHLKGSSDLASPGLPPLGHAPQPTPQTLTREQVVELVQEQLRQFRSEMRRLKAQGV